MLQALLIDGLTILCLPLLLLSAKNRKNRDGGILIIQLGKIGDLICTTPLLRALHQQDPHVNITVLCLSFAAPVLAYNPFVHEVIFVDDPRFKDVRGRVRLLAELSHRNFAASVAVLPGTLNAICNLWTYAPMRIHTGGAGLGLLGRFFHRFQTHRITYARGTRTYDHYMHIAALLGAKPVPYQHDIFLKDDERKHAQEWLSEKKIKSNDRFAILSLSAGNKLKEWPVERFVEVAQYLKNKGWKIVFSSIDRSVTAHAMILLHDPEHSVDAGGLSLRSLAAMIDKSSLFVSVDTGPLYIAHALGVPVVDILGPVDPREQPPPDGPVVALVHPPKGIAPTSFVANAIRQPTRFQRRALAETTPAMVIESINRLLYSET